MPSAAYQQALQLIAGEPVEALCAATEAVDHKEATRRVSQLIALAQDHYQQLMTELMTLHRDLSAQPLPTAPEGPQGPELHALFDDVIPPEDAAAFFGISTDTVERLRGHHSRHDT